MDVQAIQVLISVSELVDVGACRAELAGVRRVRGLVDAREVEIARRLEELEQTDPTVLAEDELANAAKSSPAKAGRAKKRGQTGRALPEVGEALANGETTGDRLDLIGNARAGLSEQEKARFDKHSAELARAAGSQTDAEFRRTIESVVRRSRVDDGLARLARQRGMARLRWWLDADGMWCLGGKFDPASGVRIQGRLRNTVERKFHDHTPEHCPTDPLDKQQHLAALALIDLILGDDATGEATAGGSAARAGATGGGSSGGNPPRGGAAGGGPRGGGPGGGGAGGGAPDVSVLIDYQTLVSGLHEDTLFEFGLGQVGLPVETIRRWGCIGEITPIVIAADGTRLALGRTTRLANRAQRRLLRVWYRTCALCEVPFDHCQIHHITWFRLQGLTDLGNLLPLCSRHHHLAHEGGWVLHLAPDRTLTVTRPGGVIHTHAPPTVRAAA